MNLILRKFHDKLNKTSHMEFRVFVYKSEITAISQYRCSYQFLDIVNNKSDVKKLIVNNFNKQLKEKLTGHRDYIFDVWII
eukprot:UN19815